ncbi:MAG: GNAT family N-acetyltransferase [Nocardioidaceae bacterium]|nr:GNAT family N-acetyltransferase [Nocardioidaceae bacterium]
MLRPASDTDLASLRSWRNQEANRAVSTNQQEITAEEHARWWAAVKDDPSRQVLVFEQDGRGLGVVTFFDIDLDEKSAGWGFYLDHETTTAEGIAMMAWIQVMKDATAYAFDTLGVDLLTGEVNEDNEAVRTMNRRFRFTEGEPRTLEDGRVFYPISLRREDRRPTRKTTGSKQ